MSLKPIRAHITNFQSIADLAFEIKGFTVVTGKTNLGKSAILRAISGSILNIPVGPFVRKGAKYCTVTLQSDDWDFKWEKGSGINRYFIPSNADKSLSNVGAGQIEPVAKMGFQSVKLGREESHPWYASQFEPIFLLSEGGSTVTDFISEVSRLQVLQDALQISSKGKKKASDEAKLRGLDLVALRDKISRVQSLANLEKLVHELELQAKSIIDYEKKTMLAESLFGKLERGKAILGAIEKVADVKIPKGDAGAEFRRINAMHRYDRALKGLAHRIIPLKGISSVKVPDMDNGEMLQLAKSKRFACISAIQSALEMLKNLDRIQIPNIDLDDDFRQLRASQLFNSKLVRHAAELKRSESELQEVQGQLASVVKDLERIPTCPTCGRTVSASKKQHRHAETLVIS